MSPLTLGELWAWPKVTVENPQHVATGVAAAEMDGRPVDPKRIPFASSRGPHRVRIGASGVRAPGF